MNHIALYRKWRSQAFRDVVGQNHIIQTLQNSLKEGRISHAYLFSGPRGTGKTSAAKIMAKAVNCEQGTKEEPCNECSACKRITEGSVMDVYEIDAASNRGVEEIREIRDKVKYSPTEVRYKVYIIDEVHMLTTEAFNALLKTLEEPPAHVIFILATTEPNRIPATIISRCQRFDFRRISLEDQVGRLQYICEQEGLTAETDALQYIARLSEGGMRDAVSLLDQIVSFSGTEITYNHVIDVTGGIDTDQFKELALVIQQKDIGSALTWIEKFMNEGKSVDKCMDSLIQYYRDVLMLKLVPNAHQMTDRILDPSQFKQLAEQYENEQIFQIIEILNHYHVEMKYASQPQTLFEIAVMKICTQPSSIQAEQGQTTSLASKVDKLEKQLAQLMQSAPLANQASAGQVPMQTARAAPPQDAKPSAQQSGAQAPAVGAQPPAARTQPAAAVQPAAGLTAPQSAAASLPSAQRSTAKLQPFMQGRAGSSFEQTCAKWSQVLSEVRLQKVTVHAWLVNGEPVAVTDKAVLIAFKNEIHLKTTEKPSNKELIEKVINEVLGQPLSIETIMQNDWQQVLSTLPDASKESASAAAEPFQLEPDPEPEQSGKHKEEWINEAIDQFGEDLVVIKED